MAFDVVFGLFLAAMVAIAVLAIRWGVGRDRAARREKESADSTANASKGER